jgi:hypothetical protein
MGAVLTFGVLAVTLFAARFEIYSDVMILIFFSGAVGGVVNNYFRLAKMVETKLVPQGSENITLAIIQMYVSLVVAGILAFVAYGLFLSGLLQGALFPKFRHTTDEYLGVTAMLLGLGPDTNIDAARSIIWAFIAGFSERFVPNMIDSFIAKAKNEK